MLSPDTIQSLYAAVYERGERFGVDRPLSNSPLQRPGARPDSIAIAGGAFGDEGKGRIVDELCARFSTDQRRMIIYRWNGGANAGHTIIVGGQRVALHQLPSGALHAGATIILGKGMVVHPGDLLAEIDSLRPLLSGRPPLDLHIDAQAVLSLDTHRAFEAALWDWASGGKGSTGRGISPAYADVLLRHPVRAGDLIANNWQERLGKHYDLYEALIKGLGDSLDSLRVPTLGTGKVTVGARSAFLSRLQEQSAALRRYIRTDMHPTVRTAWAETQAAFVFEGAQAAGLDPRWGVYPDITASDPTFSGISASTEGIVLADEIAVRAAAIKATYTSSVGQRRLPTHMDEPLATRIREDAHEYGATTRRPRDIAYIDLPCLRFYADVSGANALVLTHLDIAYPDVQIRVCTHYTDARGELAPYRPDQDYLNTITPHYRELPSWDGAALQGAQRLEDLPTTAVQYVAFLTQALGCPPLMATTGPEREAVISWV
ncbi:MAG: adenylosuccinate synthetase [Chloroflexota bacterium]|nr:adenylosuccinate synthetase [Chloroflexota bacterium]